MAEGLFDENKEEPLSDDKDDVLKGKIEELKTKSPEELAKGKAHADQFIEFLKEQNKGLVEELEKRSGSEKLLEELRAERDGKKKTEAPKGDDSPGLVPEDLDTLIEEKLNSINNKKSLESNARKVDEELRNVYGDKAREFIANKAKELGLGVSYLGDVAAKSPNAFYQLVGMDKKESSSPGMSQGTVNQEALDKSGSLTPGSNAYYQKLRREDAAKFYSPAVQRKMFEDRKKMGDSFYR